MSFFADIQNWFSGGFYGRHLGLILREIGKYQPDALSSFVSKHCGIPMRDLKNARYECEYRFKGKKSIRSADLAVFLGEETKPRILIEIKYFDKPIAETNVKAEQFEDYRYWKSREEGREVLVLSRELYQASGLVVCRWDGFARHLKPFGKRSELIQMLVEYLGEEGIVMQNVNGSSLTRYFKRLVCHTWNSGVSANNIEGPVEFSKVLKNMKLLSGAFDVYFKNAWVKAKSKYDGLENSLKAASIDFNVINKLGNIGGKEILIDHEGDLVDSLKAGGRVYVFAQHALGNGNDRYLRIRYGIRFVITPSSSYRNGAADTSKLHPGCYLYAYVWGRKVGNPSNFHREKKVNFSMVTEKFELKTDKIDHYLHQLVYQVLCDVDDAKLPIEPLQRLAVKELCKTLMAKNTPLLVE